MYGVVRPVAESILPKAALSWQSRGPVTTDAAYTAYSTGAPHTTDTADTEHMVTETLIRGMYRYWREVMEA